MASRKTVVCLAAGFGEPAPGDVVLPPAYTVAQLNAMTGVAAGSIAHASDGRAFIYTASTGLGTVTYTVTMEAAGAGKGVKVSYRNGAWVVAGTTTPVVA